LKKIVKEKYDIVEALARRYEEKGRPKVAEKVRQMQLAWFNKEPAEIRTSKEFANLDLTYDDVMTYREYRSKFTNTSKAITQDVISGLIEVVVDKKAGIYERLKDKTRSEAIADVKQIYKDWSKDNRVDSDLANKIIWKNKD
jgi:predicted metal-dependent hydrolase